MYIRRLIIDDFGAWQKRSVDLTDGFNLITGKNESGKSTLCAFIKYVFYGFNDSKERERHVNFNTMRASGSVELDMDGQYYLVFRKDGEKGKSKVIVTRADGSEFEDWKLSADTPGDYFFGIPEKLYSRSIYVSQIGGAAPDGASASAISNLLLSGDEAVNLKNATGKLDSFRRSLQLKKGRGGLIHDTEDKIAELKDEYELSLDAKRKCEGLSSEIRDTEDHLVSLKAELGEAEKAKSIARSRKLISYIQEENHLKNELSRVKYAFKHLTEANTYKGFCPNEDYLSNVKTLESEASLREQTCESLKQRMIESENERNARIPKEYKQFLALGRTKGIQEAHNAFKRKINLFALLAALFYVCALAFLVAAFFKPIFTAPMALALFAGTVLTYFLISTNKKLKAFLLSLSPDKLSYEEVCAACEEYEAYRATESSSISKAYNAELELLSQKHEELEALAEKWGKSSLSEAKQAYLTFTAALAELDQKALSIENALGINRAHLSAYSEKDREAALSFTEEELDEKVTEISDDRLSFLKHSVSTLEDQLNSLKISLASSGFDSGDPAKTLCMIDEEKKRLSELTETFEAVNLAITALSDAEISIRETVSPYLSEHSGAYFSEITNGKYPRLLLDTSLDLKYVSPEYSTPISKEHLSGGSADLAWLCLRLALHKKLSGSRPLPLILDECLVYFDDERLEKILSLLKDLSSSGTQIILFSASSRERAFVGEENTVEIR